MARYTTTQEFVFSDYTDSRAIVVSGEVNIKVWDGTTYIQSDNITTGTAELFTAGLKIQIEVVSGSFFINESE